MFLACFLKKNLERNKKNIHWKNLRNMSCVSWIFLSETLFVFPWEKTLWKSQDMFTNGFFQGKQHLAPAVDWGWEAGTVTLWARTCNKDARWYISVWVELVHSCEVGLG